MGRLLPCLVLALLLAGPSLAGPMFTTALSPSLEQPMVSSPASGSATLVFSDALDSLGFSLQMNSINTPLLQAHVHIGAPADNGPIALFLFDLCDLGTGCGPGDFRIFGNSVMLEGEATDADLRNGFSFQEILDAIAGNLAYINVHTEQFRSGEIRGNLVPEPGTLLLIGSGLAGLALLGRRTAA